MDNNTDYIELIKRARLGDKKCLNRLAEVGRVRLYEYVHRLTLQKDLTEDIVQETILEMYKIFDKLKKTEQFWAWLEGVAFNKIRSYYGKRWRHKTVPLSAIEDFADINSPDGLTDMVTAELKQIVLKSMHQLQPRQRAVLAMRCYKGLKYSEIAKLMNCSVFGVQALFYRAKKALAKELSRHGFSKGTLLTALVIFGKMTATTEASAASISVTATTLKVGAPAALAAIVASKTAVVSLTTAGVLTVGGIIATSEPEKTTAAYAPERPVKNSYNMAQARPSSKDKGKLWFYYPSNANGAVIMRLDYAGGSQWLQNDQANYHKRKNMIYMNNCRMWHNDLTVWRLPADRSELTDFLSRIDGKQQSFEYISNAGDGLLVIAGQDKNDDYYYTQVTFGHDVMDEEYFRYDWAKGARVVDNRDMMHKRGWTYFTVEGDIGGQAVHGTGQIPFVYAISEQYPPWLKLKIGSKEMVDHTGGRLFKGLSRPWMGLHTIDTVRRDAAEQKVWSEATLLEPDKVQVKLSYDNYKIIYTIDMEADVIDEIVFLSEAGEFMGQLEFSYMQDIKTVGNKFAEPRRGTYRQSPQKSEGMLWLFELISDK